MFAINFNSQISILHKILCKYVTVSTPLLPFVQTNSRENDYSTTTVENMTQNATHNLPNGESLLPQNCYYKIQVKHYLRYVY